MSAPNRADNLDPERFEVSRGTLLVDRGMTQAIRFGGLAVIVAVFGIFLFIFKEIVPLFGHAEVGEGGRAKVEQATEVLALGVDEWGEMPYLYDGGRELCFVRLADGEATRVPLEFPEGAEITAVAHDPLRKRLSFGLSDGRVGSVVIVYQTEFAADGSRTLVPVVEAEPWFDPEVGGGAVRRLAYGDGGERRMIVVERDGSDEGGETGRSISVLRLGQKRSLMGRGKLVILGEDDLSGLLPGRPVMLRASPTGEALLVVLEGGVVVVLGEDDGEIVVKQEFVPFPEAGLAGMDFVFGGMSVVLTGGDGRQEGWSLFRPEGQRDRSFGRTKEFPRLAAGERVLFAASQRNKSFLTGVGSGLSLRYGTTAAVRWEGSAAIEPVHAVFDGKGESVILADGAGAIQQLRIEDPHPEAGWRAFFGKVWYEGAAGPEHVWQSTGGSDEFEPKLSLVPLVIGSLKGTLYALLFSIPIALLAAVFSANFLPPRIKRVIKPMMEIMASLPSVVLGFLGGLWLAPLIENRVPSLLLAILGLPLAALLAAVLVGRLPRALRSRFEGGREWWVVIPFLVVAVVAGWQLGPWLESRLFVYQDPATGREIGDFRLWWPQVTGLAFDQRNSLVVGFVMGFAVIPVIFTIAEDALSNVPKSLTAASAALGASRWQVIRTVVLPVASPGIFSALMIGFGRAVGETMIMVMATGNTPVMDWNIFNGMRTLSANIAVELPEAPVGSTHYRALFLGAMMLFLMTFALNTAAEVMRTRLREKYKLV